MLPHFTITYCSFFFFQLNWYDPRLCGPCYTLTYRARYLTSWMMKWLCHVSAIGSWTVKETCHLFHVGTQPIPSCIQWHCDQNEIKINEAWMKFCFLFFVVIYCIVYFTLNVRIMFAVCFSLINIQKHTSLSSLHEKLSLCYIVKKWCYIPSSYIWYYSKRLFIYELGENMISSKMRAIIVLDRTSYSYL